VVIEFFAKAKAESMNVRALRVPRQRGQSGARRIIVSEVLRKNRTHVLRRRGACCSDFMKLYDGTLDAGKTPIRERQPRTPWDVSAKL
jgi:hypothetical protein